MKYSPLILAGVIVLLAVIGLVFWKTGPLSQSPSPVATDQPLTETTEPSGTSEAVQPLAFSTPKKSAHYESNTPAHGATVAGVPPNVVIDFNFDLAKPSEIKMLKDGSDYGTGETLIDANKLALRRNMNPTAPDGLYTVEYKACWPDGSCHDGSFQFAIDRSQAGSYEDHTGKKEVEIALSNVQFRPQHITVSKGTKITWVNDDTVEHYINTDSHPAHTYYPAQNSKILKKGERFSLTFNTPGAYPYHCSAHAASMIGTVLVL